MERKVQALLGEHARHGGEHKYPHGSPHGQCHVEHVQVVPEVVDTVDHREHDDVHDRKTEHHVDPEQRIGTTAALGVLVTCAVINVCHVDSPGVSDLISHPDAQHPQKPCTAKVRETCAVGTMLLRMHRARMTCQHVPWKGIVKRG